MNLVLQAEPPPLYEANDRVVCISGTRIPLERVVRAFLVGSTPEQIAQDYDVLSVETVYAVVNYYLQHRSEVDSYLAEAERDTARVRNEVEQASHSAGIRDRLLAKRSAESK